METDDLRKWLSPALSERGDPDNPWVDVNKGVPMTANDLAMGLLRDGVPLSLLLDLAGYGLTSQELLEVERPEPVRQLVLAP